MRHTHPLSATTDSSTGALLVPERQCGECQVCCEALRIEEAELKKPPGVACRFLGRGCTIHANRFSVCRNWFCGWRLQPQLDDSWRPDRSGVLLVPEMNPTPGFETHGYTMQLASPAPLSSPEILNRLCGFIAGHTPLYLALAGHQTKALANPLLAPLIAAGNAGAIMAALGALVRDLTTPRQIRQA